MKHTTWKMLAGYILLLMLMILCSTTTNAQTIKVKDGITVVHFNANWNAANDVGWFSKLKDCNKQSCDIATDTEAQKKYEIVVVPTIIIFNEGEEVKRFQADISFTMKATLEEVQEKLEETIMEGM